jgi:hypothetical protein
MAERTGCPVLLSLWSYVQGTCLFQPIQQTEVHTKMLTQPVGGEKSRHVTNYHNENFREVLATRASLELQVNFDFKKPTAKKFMLTSRCVPAL